MVTSVLECPRGTAVEVRTRYLSSWAPGFEVESVHDDQIEVRRRSDGVVLPVAVPATDVRLCESVSTRG